MLLPTQRERKRYLAFEVLAQKEQKEMQWNSVKRAITAAVKEYIGVDGLAQTGLLFVKNNQNKGLLRTSHTMLNQVKAALIFITEIDNHKVIVRSLAASGMLNKAAAKIK